MTGFRFELLGWLLFGVSALLFMIASARNGDWVSFGGSAAFMLANISFVISLSYKTRKENPQP